jgi:hypothetical protein
MPAYARATEGRMLLERLGLVRGGRDLRVDFFRGIALWSIFVNHMPGNVLGNVTLRNFVLADATEAFVLLAGYAAGLTYGRSMERHGWAFAAADVVRRAWTLYIAHIFLFVVFTAQVAFSAARFDNFAYIDEMQVNAFGEEPYRALLEALMLRFQPAYLDILPLYIVLLLMLALALKLLRRPALLVALSFGLYAIARMAGINIPTWTGGHWFFNPLAWQFLFCLGAVLGFAPPQPVRHPRRIDLVAALVVAGSFFLVLLTWHRPDWAGILPTWAGRTLLAIDKTGLHPFRLVSILALLWLAARLVPADARWLRALWAQAFVLAGQQALPVFCVGIFLSFLGRLVMEWRDAWDMQAVVNVVGAAMLLGVAAMAAWYKAKGRGERAGRAAAQPTPARAPLPSAAGADTRA